MAVRTRLAVLMAERHITTTRLAKLSKISRTTITALKNGQPRMIRFSTIDVLCQVLGVTPGELIEYTPKSTFPKLGVHRIAKQEVED